jgi:hypothetical protein
VRTSAVAIPFLSHGHHLRYLPPSNPRFQTHIIHCDLIMMSDGFPTMALPFLRPLQLPDMAAQS